MNILFRMEKGIAVCLFSSFFVLACVNHIPGEKAAVSNGDIPLKFTADIHEVTYTRVAGNGFEENDEVGVFALVGSSTMKEERYADNLRFFRTSEKVFESSEPIYYPDDEVTLRLISYYPYQEEGVNMGESTMSVAVETDQNLSAGYFCSDFLVASQNLQSAPKGAIALHYDHKFFKLKIALVGKEGEELQGILDADPKLSVCGFYTKAIYDFQKETYSAFSNEKSITPAGKWEIQGDRLSGKEVILIPQETTLGYQYIVLDVGGKIYTSPLPSSLQLQSGKQSELAISFIPTEDVLISKVEGEINSWEDGNTGQSGSEVFHNYVDVSKLVFDDSKVYKVLSARQQVAEICKEYLVTPDFSSQAIVVYPIKDNHAVDLSKGTVVQLVGHADKVHGGTVAWDLKEHSLKYTPGNQAARSKVYILPDGQIALSMPEEMLPVLAMKDIMRDVRGSSIHNYPIVKIGTQYWMGSNLKTSLYIDGEEIPKLEIMNAGATGYLLSQTDKSYYFYSFGTIVSNKLLPVGWNMPDWNDWNMLKTYLSNDASLLKTGTWKAISTGAGAIVGTATNLTGFDGYPVGMYAGKFQSAYEGKYLSYWTLNEAGTDADEKIFLLRSDKNEIAEGNTGLDKAYAIRCIRK